MIKIYARCYTKYNEVYLVLGFLDITIDNWHKNPQTSRMEYIYKYIKTETHNQHANEQYTIYVRKWDIYLGKKSENTGWQLYNKVPCRGLGDKI